MSKLSSTTLFHFTPKMEYLKSILKNGFSPRYCREKYLPGAGNESIEEIAIPMVCFCDIPLSQITEHSQFYGSYGIGLSKEWIFENQIAPVQYSYENSNPILMLKEAMSNFKKIEDLFEISDKEDDENLPFEKYSTYTKIIQSVTYQTFFTKKFEGDTLDKNGNLIFKKFYDEKEWRYIPSPKLVCGSDYLLYIDENFETIIPVQNELISKHIQLKIEPKDIKFILVKNLDEKEEIFKFIPEIFKNRPYLDIINLQTKIIDLESIKEDF